MSGNVLLAVMLICAIAGYLAVSSLINAWRGSPAAKSVPEVPARVADEVGWARQVLGIDGYVNAVGLKERYHKLLAQYHPDKTEQLGPEIQQIAADRTQQIIRAFEILKDRIQD
jgi:preprotein translocase subunit Sec63